MDDFSDRKSEYPGSEHFRVSQVQHSSPGSVLIGSSHGRGRIASPSIPSRLSAKPQGSSRTSGFQSPNSQENQHYSDLKHSIDTFIQGSTQVQSEIQRISSFCSTLNSGTPPRDTSLDVSSPLSLCTQVTEELRRLDFWEVDVDTCERSVLVSILHEALGRLEQAKTQRQVAVLSGTEGTAMKLTELDSKLSEAKNQITHFQDIAFLLEKKVKWWKDRYAEKTAELEGKVQVKTEKKEALESESVLSELRRLRSEFETNSAKLLDLKKLYQKPAPSNLLHRLEKLFSASGDEEVYKGVKLALRQGNKASDLHRSLLDLSRTILESKFKKSSSLSETVKSAQLKVKELQESKKDLSFLSRKVREYCHCSEEASQAEVVSVYVASSGQTKGVVP